MFSLLQFKSVIQDCPPCFSIFCSRWHINYLVHALKQHLTDIQILWQQLTLLCKKKVSHCVQATLWSLASQQIKIHNVTHELLNQCMNETATQVTTATTTKNQIKSNHNCVVLCGVVLCGGQSRFIAVFMSCSQQTRQAQSHQQLPQCINQVSRQFHAIHNTHNNTTFESANQMVLSLGCFCCCFVVFGSVNVASTLIVSCATQTKTMRVVLLHLELPSIQFHECNLVKHSMFCMC